MNGKGTIESLRDRFEIMSREPISEGTKRIRRNLVASSIIAILIETANVRPTKIVALGIDEIPPEIIPILVGCITWYFFIAFFLHGTKDFLFTYQKLWFSQVGSAFPHKKLPEDNPLEAELTELECRLAKGIVDERDRKLIQDIRQRLEANKTVAQALARPTSLWLAAGFHVVSQGFDHFGAAMLGLFAVVVTAPTVWHWISSFIT